MVLGLIQYVLGGRHLGQAGLKPNAGDDPAARASAQRLLFGGAAVLIAARGAPLDAA